MNALNEGASVQILGPWTDALAASREESFWPGPWSIRDRSRDSQLVGRDDESAEIAYAVRNRNLVVLSGPSGVGKTSLLHIRVIRELRDRGFIVAMCEKWGGAQALRETVANTPGDGASDEISRFLADALRTQFAEQGIEIDDDARLVEQLDAGYGSQVVIVLDQFEEVIRQQPALFDEFRSWIEKVVDGYRVRILVSMRSEYVHRLADLDVARSRRQDIQVAVINDPESIEEIVRRGKAEGQGSMITDAGVARLLELWSRAGTGSRSPRVRLLHLQAALFVLWSTWIDAGKPAAGEPVIDAAQIEELEREAVAWLTTTRRRRRRTKGNATDRDRAIAFFEYTLVKVVKLHLTMCERVFGEVREAAGLFDDDVLIEGVRGVLVRMAEYLSSGGYKVDQDHIHLAELALHTELDTLGYLEEAPRVDAARPEDEARDIITEFAALATGRTPLEEDGISYDWAVAPSRVLRKQILSRVKPQSPTVSDDDESPVTAGPLMGQSPAAVLIEECRRYFLAVQWLEAGEIVRLSPTDDDSSVVSLTHDGFGQGLNEWADDHDSDPDTDLHRVTAAVGEVFQWPDAQRDDAENPFRRGRYVNLRWRSCRVVKAKFIGIVFMNCDFRGTAFVECVFEGVSFVNCILDGVQFDECTIRGRSTELENELAEGRMRTTSMPSFIDRKNLEEIPLLAHYGERPVPDADVIYSPRPGVAVQPARFLGAASADDGTQFSIATASGLSGVTSTVDEQRGGLVMYGGRVSSVAFYGCRFVADGEVSLRHVRGTSLDFVEHTGGRVELYDAYLRGVSVSTPVLAREERAARHLGFQALDSHLENVWFSTALTGLVELQGSEVWQLFNASAGESGGLEVVNDARRRSDVLGAVDLADADAAPDPEAVRRAAGLIDYRSARDQALLERRAEVPRSS